ncbi:MAG: bifunctional (p)ppGpp synthetase/guanosine-3',5'-bis(diphosphate) 3'-pyrophosphohydrolase [Oscillospiraceae bacterium]|nr:bifunctional (p)ppGpp synthetase/guanosine-3',5'-bis(diphosphate) 3'-pyrophosphohydrolase [Oscillospiraceae bacterium]
MIYTALTRRAAQIAEAAHRGQCDKSGFPYIMHPVHLAEQMPDEIKAAVALLHDVVEDTDITLDALKAEFPPRVTDAVALLTHDPQEDYFAYVARIRENPDAAAVKRADLMHNLDDSRILSETVPAEKRRRMREKYLKALALLDGTDLQN